MAAAPKPSDDEPKKVNPVERAVRAVDAFQQRTFPLNFLFGVVKKFGDDSAGSQAALIAYYGFLSIFPLLLVMITLLTMFVSPGTEHRICLLYTSDAADDLLCVDLGGRRVIK